MSKQGSVLQRYAWLVNERHHKGCCDAHSRMSVSSTILQTKAQYHNIVDWPKSSFWFFHNLMENQNTFFGQPNSTPGKAGSRHLKLRLRFYHPDRCVCVYTQFKENNFVGGKFNIYNLLSKILLYNTFPYMYINWKCVHVNIYICMFVYAYLCFSPKVILPTLWNFCQQNWLKLDNSILSLLLREKLFQTQNQIIVWFSIVCMWLLEVSFSWKE